MQSKKPNLDKPEGRTTGIHQFFTKQQEKRPEPVSTITTTTVSDDSDDSFEVVFEKCKPGPSTPATPLQQKTVKTPSLKTPETPKNATKWGEALQKNSLVSGESSAGRDWQNPFSMKIGKSRKSAEKNTKSDLLKNGYESHDNSIFYPVDEPIRPFELNLIKCVSSSNCCIALPSSAPSTPARMSAVSVFNFMKWFPNCRVLVVSSSDEWFSSLEQLGLENNVTKIQTMAQFKKPKNGLGKILFCTTPQCAVKVVESSEAEGFLEDIRLVLLDIKSTDCCSKYKPILNALTMRETFFRCVVLTTSTSNTSRRTASITKRQLMITNLQLSDWIEQTENDFAFRCSNIPSGVEVKYWKLTDNSERLNEIIKKFEAFAESLMEELANEGIVTSRSIRKCIWMDWKNIKTDSTLSSERETIAEVLVTCYKYLLVEGVVAARNYVKKCATLPEVQKYTNQMMGVFGGFSEFPFKYQLMTPLIENFLKMDNHVRGVILCRDSEQATDILNFLELNLPKSVNFMRIVPTGHPSARNLWQISRISTVFVDKKSPKILIIPVKIPEFIGFSDTIPLAELTFIASISRESVFNFRKFSGAHVLILNEQLEKLRKADGRLIVDDGKFAQKETKAAKVGAVERYDFKFETSRLRLNPANLRVNFFYPRTVGWIFSEESADGSSSEKLISFNSASNSLANSRALPKEQAESNRRLKKPDATKSNKKKRPLCELKDASTPDPKRPYLLEDTDDEQIWNQDVQVLGDTKSSKRSQNLVKNPRGTYEWATSKQKKRFEYVNEISDKKRLQHLDELLRNLDSSIEED